MHQYYSQPSLLAVSVTYVPVLYSGVQSITTLNRGSRSERRFAERRTVRGSTDVTVCAESSARRLMYGYSMYTVSTVIQYTVVLMLTRGKGRNERDQILPMTGNVFHDRALYIDKQGCPDSWAVRTAGQNASEQLEQLGLSTQAVRDNMTATVHWQAAAGVWKS